MFSHCGGGAFFSSPVNSLARVLARMTFQFLNLKEENIDSSYESAKCLKRNEILLDSQCHHVYWIPEYLLYVQNKLVS